MANWGETYNNALQHVGPFGAWMETLTRATIGGGLTSALSFTGRMMANIAGADHFAPSSLIGRLGAGTSLGGRLGEFVGRKIHRGIGRTFAHAWNLAGGEVIGNGLGKEAALEQVSRFFNRGIFVPKMGGSVGGTTSLGAIVSNSARDLAKGWGSGIIPNSRILRAAGAVVVGRELIKTGQQMQEMLMGQQRVVSGNPMIAGSDRQAAARDVYEAQARLQASVVGLPYTLKNIGRNGADIRYNGTRAQIALHDPRMLLQGGR